MNDQIRCSGCGLPVPDVPEGSGVEATLCNACAAKVEPLVIAMDRCPYCGATGAYCEGGEEGWEGGFDFCRCNTCGSDWKQNWGAARWLESVTMEDAQGEEHQHDADPSGEVFYCTADGCGAKLKCKTVWRIGWISDTELALDMDPCPKCKTVWRIGLRLVPIRWERIE